MNLKQILFIILSVSCILLIGGCLTNKSQTKVDIPSATSSVLGVEDSQRHRAIKKKYSAPSETSQPEYATTEPVRIQSVQTIQPTLTASTDTSLKNQPSSHTNVFFGNYYALVIGNNDYRFLDGLNTAKNDATSVGEILKRDYGFTVTSLFDATRADILTALNNFRMTLTDQDNLLIYYAGHGWLDEDADEGYWLPVDAADDNPVNWISNASITSTLKAMSAKHVLIVADSCYSGKLVRGIKIKIRPPDYLVRLSRKKARNVMASGGLEPVMDSGGKVGHSVFASAFIDALQDNTEAVIDTAQMFPSVRQKVMISADQTPEYSDIRKAGHDGGDFLFVRH